MADPRKGHKNSSEIETVIVVHASPRSTRVAISEESPATFKIRLTSPPVQGAANSQLIQVLADKLSLPARHIELISGERGKWKRLKIKGLDLQQITRLLSQP